MKRINVQGYKNGDAGYPICGRFNPNNEYGPSDKNGVACVLGW